MGFWSGVAKGLQEHRQREFETSEREGQQQFILGRDEADRAFQREQLAAEIQGRTQQTLLDRVLAGGGVGLGGGSGGGRASSGSTAPNPNHSLNVLISRFGMDEETLSRVAMDENPNSLGKAVEILEAADAKYRETYGEPLPDEIAADMFRTAVVTAPEDVAIDWDMLEGLYGGEIPPEYRVAIEQQNRRPGETSFVEPVIVGPAKIEDINQAREFAASQVVNLALAEKERIDTEIGILNSGLTDPNITEQERAEATQILNRLTETRQKIDTAMASYEKNVHLPLLQLNVGYGALGLQAMDRLREQYPGINAAWLGIEYE